MLDEPYRDYSMSYQSVTDLFLIIVKGAKEVKMESDRNRGETRVNGRHSMLKSAPSLMCFLL